MAGVEGDAGESVRSTVFRVRKARRLSKIEQQRAIAGVFAEGYRIGRGVVLEDRGVVKKDPPDWIFSGSRPDGSRVNFGVEMFELYQFYDIRALLDDLTNAIYSEFDKRRLSARYLGVCVQALPHIHARSKEGLERGWNELRIRNPVGKTAKEFVDAVVEALLSRDALPDGDHRRWIAVNPSRYPALAVVCDRLIVHRVRDRDERRSDGMAAPLVMIGGGTALDAHEMQRRIGETLREKMSDRRRWSVSVDRAILIAHDLPREHFYQGYGMEWSEWLKGAASERDALTVFDEVWLVTFQTLQGEAHLICGRDR